MINSIPVITVNESTLSRAYEVALESLKTSGIEFQTQYDKPGDPKSLDATMNITIREPLRDPMIHKAFPGGIEDLREYVMELQGLKDHWVKNMDDPEDTRWEYTYHGRFENWGQWKERNKDPFATCFHFNDDGTFTRENNPKEHFAGLMTGVNQIEAVISKLVKQPFTRQAQMITWMPHLDLNIFDPPCLQSLWYRMLEDEDCYYLNCNVRIRSNDAWGAYFMNSFGITMFNKEVIALEIEKRTGKPVHLGRMNWHADSWHIYGKDLKQAEERLFNRIPTTEFKDRVYNFYDETIQEIYNEAEPAIFEKVRKVDERK